MPTTPEGKVFSFVHSNNERSVAAYKSLARTYGQCTAQQADIIVALGGDGFMLTALNQFGSRGKPVFGMNRGTVGFLLNDYKVKDLPGRLDNAVSVRLNRLIMNTCTSNGVWSKSKAINEVALFRQSAQSARVNITINGQQRMESLVCDGILLATPAGSTAYNLSAHGPIMPLDSNLLALTPISAFRPRRWPGALLSNKSKVRFEVLDHEKRPASATADGAEVRDVRIVDIESDRRSSLNVYFDPEHSLQERILQEQFVL